MTRLTQSQQHHVNVLTKSFLEVQLKRPQLDVYSARCGEIRGVGSARCAAATVTSVIAPNYACWRTCGEHQRERAADGGLNRAAAQEAGVSSQSLGHLFQSHPQDGKIHEASRIVNSKC